MAEVSAGPALAPDVDPATAGVPLGGYVCAAAPIELHAGLTLVAIKVRNTGDRPVQVGSHFHFFEANAALAFDRAAAFGCRLAIPASTALRFEPGDEREVNLVRFGGRGEVFGFNNLVDGATGGADATAARAAAIERARARGYRFLP